MVEKDMQAFFAKESELNLDDYVIERFLIETTLDPEEAAAELAKEHSTALWKRVNVDEDFREKHGAKVLRIEDVKSLDASFVHAFTERDKKHNQFVAVIAHPHINFGAKFPNMLTAMAGEGVFFSKGVNAIKVLDLEFPKKFLRGFEGPKFGVKGFRKKLQVQKRPLVMGVVKPNVGLNPKQFAEIAYQALKGGLDIAKDDEMLADVAYSPLKERLEAVTQLLYKAEDETGEKKMYLANITDEVDKLQELHDMVASYDDTCVMLNAMPVGLSACRVLCKNAKVPVVSHFDFIAPFSRHPGFGLSTELVTKLKRIAGFDAIIFPGLGKRMISTDAEVKANLQECLGMLHNVEPCLPVPGGSDWAGSLPKMIETFGTTDFSMVPGRGIFGHPSGPEAGARSIRQAWEAVDKGVALEEYSKSHKELAKAIEAFGGG